MPIAEAKPASENFSLRHERVFFSFAKFLHALAKTAKPRKHGCVSKQLFSLKFASKARAKQLFPLHCAPNQKVKRYGLKSKTTFLRVLNKFG